MQYQPEKRYDVAPGDHVCCLYDTEEARLELLTSFLKQSLQENHKVTYVVDGHTPEPFLKHMENIEVDAAQARQEGRLRIVPAQDAFWGEDVFEPDAVVNFLREETRQAREEGFEALRVTVEMSWLLRNVADSQQLTGYEVKLDEFLAENPTIVVCQYDRRRFPPQVLLDVLRTHPVFMGRSGFLENFYYSPPVEREAKDAAQAELANWMKDIAADVGSEALSRKQEAPNLQEIFNNTKDAMYYHSLTDEGMPGQFLEVNPKACEKLGYSRDEFLQMTLQDLDAAMNSEYLQSIMSKLLNEGFTNFETEHVAKDGSKIPVEVNAHLFTADDERRVVLVVRDITERRRAEQQLRENEQRYKSLFYETPLGTFRYDVNGVITECNGTFEKIIGSFQDVLVGLNMIGDLKNARMVQEVKRSLEEGEGYYEGEYTSTTGGKTTTVRVMLKGLRNEQDQIIAGMGLVEDITERKEMEWELRETNRQLEETVEELRNTQQQLIPQERERALTTMASGIAHDFNNALFPIQEFSEMLMEEPALLDDRETAIQYLDRIHKAASRASETIRRMRKFYRPEEATRFTELDLNSVVTDAVLITEPRWKDEAAAAGKNIEVHTELKDIPSVYGSEAELNDVMTNLIFNAVDAMPEGGRISVSTYMQGDRVVLEFSDNGIGMSEETRRKCLDPFYTEKGTHGSGLGLATVQGAVRRHDGELTIESTEGVGTTFYIKLPVAETTTAPKKDADRQPTTALKILAIEDEEVHREVLYNVLEAEGHQVETAGNGTEGLKKFDTEWFDLVIIDRAMPKMRGDDLAQKVKETAPDKPVIMLTGFGDMMDAAGEKPPNVDMVLSKRSTRKALQDAIREAVNR